MIMAAGAQILRWNSLGEDRRPPQRRPFARR
jgi:hypothetical protein